jgi:hypothetical protein
LYEFQYVFRQFSDLAQDAHLAVGAGDMWRKKGDHRHFGLATPASSILSDHVKWRSYLNFHGFLLKHNTGAHLLPEAGAT